MGKITRLCDLNFTELFRNYEFQKDPDSNSSDEDEDVPAEREREDTSKEEDLSTMDMLCGVCLLCENV